MISVGEFIEVNPDAVWTFAQRWGTTPDDDLRTAVATLLLEHLLEHHFDVMIGSVEHAARNDQLFADTVCRCWKLGQAKEPSRAGRFDKLVTLIRASPRRLPKTPICYGRTDKRKATTQEVILDTRRRERRARWPLLW
jgi:hypothetical protein